MTYKYNPHRHVKIWLTGDRDSFLNTENQLRLIYMRHINPDDEIYFIYDRSLLSDDSLAQLNQFCEQHQIIAKDAQTDILPNCNTVEEVNLITLYQDNIMHLDQGGNLGAASDVLRWLRPAYELGTYTDLDVTVDTNKLPPVIEVEESLLVNIGSIALDFLGTNYESLCVTNDILAVIDSKAALPRIKKIQQTIYKASSPNTTQSSCLFSDHLDEYELNMSEMVLGIYTEKKITCSKRIAEATDEVFALDTFYQSMLLLDTLSCGKTARELRYHIIQSTENNGSYRKWIEETAPLIQQVLTITKDLSKIQKNNNACNVHREETRLDLLKHSVVYSTGPMSLLFGMFGTMYSRPEQITEKALPHSFSYYGLDKVFVSNNSLPFHASRKDVQRQFTKPLGEGTNDLSWLKEGQDVIRLREQKIDTSAITLQRFFRGSQARNELQYIEKIAKTNENHMKI